MSLTSSSATSATTAPGYYTSYLSDLATQGQAAANPVTGAQFAGPTDLQNAAFQGAATNVGNYQPSLAAAGTDLAGAAGTNIAGAASPYLSAGTTTSGLSAANPYLQQGTQGADQLVGNYMNPYTQQVVDQIRAANQQNIAQNLSPGLTGGAVGAGQFGSQRGANALALGVSNANLGALSQQAQALQSGYTAAMANAQQQRANQLAAGQTAGGLQNVANANQIAAGQVAQQGATQSAQNQLNTGIQQGNLATTTQNLGLGDVNAQSILGAQQQAINQNQQMFPFQRLQAQANLMQGQQIPMSTVQTSTGSPLSAIAGLGALGVGMFQTPGGGGQSAATGLSNWYNNLIKTPSAATGAAGQSAADQAAASAQDAVLPPGYSGWDPVSGAGIPIPGYVAPASGGTPAEPPPQD
jgi:hypothetical protein